MPVYVYRNLKTGETFEVEQRMIEPALAADPVTGDPVKRLIQPVGIAFKGSGFYVTDSRSSSSRNTKAASSATSSDAAPAESKSDAGATDKPAPSAPPVSSAKPAAASGGAAD
jgi:predicted nucleic acid-binding Zn ribbon protein